jgi:D-3-phosphoglycerate dehydrogenase
MHLNIPKMLVGIPGILSEKNLNIENMVNKSKKDYACTLLDLNAEVSDDIIESISRIDGVLKVRVIKR